MELLYKGVLYHFDFYFCFKKEKKEKRTAMAGRSEITSLVFPELYDIGSIYQLGCINDKIQG